MSGGVPDGSDPNSSLVPSIGFCVSCRELLEPNDFPNCFDCRLKADIATLQEKQKERFKKRSSSNYPESQVRLSPPPVSFIDIPDQSNDLDDTSSIILGAGVSVQSGPKFPVPPDHQFTTSTYVSTTSVQTESPSSFVADIISGKRPIMGAGSSLRRIGFQLVTNWGLTDNASSCVAFTSLSLHDPQVKLLCAHLPKNFFSVGGESPRAMRDRMSDILETQSVLRDQFTSTTMPLCLPTFLECTKQLKKSFVELIRINLRESICDSARNCFCFVNYSPQTSLHNRKHLSFEFDSGRPNLGCFFEIIYNAFTSDWVPLYPPTLTP
jgi:hypothetical protein